MEEVAIIEQTSIVNELAEIIKTKTIDFENDPTLKAFEEADRVFQKLVEVGIAKKRGYNLMTIEDSHLQALNFASNFSPLSTLPLNL